jgi:disulfide bond formation protein DsbB
MTIARVVARIANEPLRAANRLAVAVPLSLLLGAVLFERIGHLVPCEMCMMQRWPLVAAAAIGVFAMFLRNPSQRRIAVLSAGMGILASSLIAIDHLGVERKWWEGHTTCTSSMPKGLSTADFLKEMMSMPLIRCDTPQWTMMGLSLADLNALLSGATAIAVTWLVLRSRRVGGRIAADAA